MSKSQCLKLTFVSIGTRLRKWRKENKIKINDIINITGISTGALNNYENDKRDIPASFLITIHEKLNADIYYIITGVSKNDEKLEILESYKKLSEINKAKAEAYIKGLLESEQNHDTEDQRLYS